MTHTVTTSPSRRRLGARRLAAVLAAAAVGSIGVLAPTAGAVPGVPASKFDPVAAGWASYSNQSATAFDRTLVEKRGQGYLPMDLDIATDSGYEVGSVWQRNLDGRDWRQRRDLTSAQFTAEWESAKRAGFRPVEQQTYVLGGVRRWAGLWIKNTEGYPWASHRGQDNAQYLASSVEHRAAGLMPIDYDAYTTAGGLRHDTVWVKAPPNTDWYLGRNYRSAAEFRQQDAALKSTHRLIAFDAVHDGADQRYTGIWINNPSQRDAAVQIDQTKAAYDTTWRVYTDLGYRMVAFDRYQTTGGDRYAAIWRQNS